MASTILKRRAGRRTATPGRRVAMIVALALIAGLAALLVMAWRAGAPRQPRPMVIELPAPPARASR